MKIVLSDKTELSPIMVTGAKRAVQGATRDALTFVFAADAGMDTLDKMFTPASCESITIIEDNGAANIHNGYTVRAELSRRSYQTSEETADTPAVYEDRITVVMAQRTYTESMLAGMQETVDLLVLDSLTESGVESDV